MKISGIPFPLLFVIKKEEVTCEKRMWMHMENTGKREWNIRRENEKRKEGEKSTLSVIFFRRIIK